MSSSASADSASNDAQPPLSGQAEPAARPPAEPEPANTAEPAPVPASSAAAQNPSADAAHAVWVELVTRIATQRLHYRSGEEETASRSVVDLFKKTRELMEGHPGAVEFQRLALEMLNDVIRPCTARWHRWQIPEEGKFLDGKPVLRFRDETLRRKFREELQELQDHLRPFADHFLRLALNNDPDAVAKFQAKTEEAATGPDLGNALPLLFRTEVTLRHASEKKAGIAPGEKAPSTIDGDMRDSEAKAIRRRRAAFGDPDPRPVMNATGLALSGGGIRSATFCLGIIQALQRHKMFASFDYLSTVSGGGYLGSFLSCCLGASPAAARNAEEAIVRRAGSAVGQSPRLSARRRVARALKVESGFAALRACVEEARKRLVAAEDARRSADAALAPAEDARRFADPALARAAEKELVRRCRMLEDCLREAEAARGIAWAAAEDGGLAKAAKREIARMSREFGATEQERDQWSAFAKEAERLANESLEELSRLEPRLQAAADSPALARVKLDVLFQTTETGAESEAIRHLRNHSKYLLHGGSWGALRIVGVVLTGCLISLLMLLTVPLAAAWAARGLKIWESELYILFWTLLCAVAVCWLFIPLVQRLAQGSGWDSRWRAWRTVIESITITLAVITLAAGAAWAAPKLVMSCEDFSSWASKKLDWLKSWKPEAKQLEKIVGLLGGLVPLALGALSRRRDGTTRPGAQFLFYLTAPVFFFLAFIYFASALGVGGRPPGSLLMAGLFSVLFGAWVFLFLNVNTFSLHRYYRDRLCECYLALRGVHQRSWLRRIWEKLRYGIRNDGPTTAVPGIGTLLRLPLSALGARVAAPYHLINATLNAEGSREPELRGRNGDFFLFSREFCGSPLTGYVPTTELETLDPHVDLGTAMAISGAAASTNMGWQSMPRFRFLMTLFNVRLGYWLRRPGGAERAALRKGPGLRYLLREMTGAVHEDSSYVNLSDGGHIENLAAYELLRRQCKFIVCVDAGMEPGMECADLMRLQRYAAIDFGIRLHFDPADLTLLPTNYSRAYAVLVKIDYRPEECGGRETSDHLGWMLYLKLAVTGTEPRYVLDYRRQNPAFPHQTTGDQFYDEAQFEAYRALGECAANSLFRREILGAGGDPATLEEWFRALADSLLPDNDEAFRPREERVPAGPAIVAPGVPPLGGSQASPPSS